jgi:hypothetical protein
MEYMHERGIIHRDLKSLNILLDTERRARICDFGLVRLKSLAPMTGMIGTPQWMAPEILMCSIYYDGKVDVFSYGIVLWELLTGGLPYHNAPMEKLGYMVVQEGRRPLIPDGTPRELSDLITACWATSAQERPTFTQIIQLLNAPGYHFPGTIEEELWERAGGRRKKTPSFSDSVKAVDGELLIGARSGAPVDRVIAGLKEAIAGGHTLSVARSIADLAALHKANLLAPAGSACFDELVRIARETTGEHQEMVLRAIGDFVAHRQIFEKFRIAGGVSMLEEMIKNSEIAEMALGIYIDHIGETVVTLDAIKSLLRFSPHPKQALRETALRGLFRVVEVRFDKLRSMPSFVHHILYFTVKPLAITLYRELLVFTRRFLEAIVTLPDSVLAQLLWVHSNAPLEARPEAVACVAAAARFPSVQAAFPPDFWRGAGSDFKLNFPIFKAFVPNVPANFSEMILVLRDQAAENNGALALLVSAAQVRKCAEIVVTHLPIQNQSSPNLLFRLYFALSAVDGAELLIGQETEFYAVCRLVISTEHQHDASKLIRRVAINPILLESSGLIEQVVLLVTTSTDPRALWNLMAVVFTIARERFFQAFTYLIPKLTEFEKGSVTQLRMGAFLCLAEFADYCEEVDVSALLMTACEFVNAGNSAVRCVCYDCLMKVIEQISPEMLQNATTLFLGTYTGVNAKTPEFATALLNAAAGVADFDQTARAALEVIARGTS